MTRTEHLLTILGEECVEVSQRVSKALRFSLEEKQPGLQDNNAERILSEFYEAVAMVELLQKEGKLPIWDHDAIVKYKEFKLKRVEVYLLHSKNVGTLTEQPSDGSADY
jgi:hypothetical protein